jgi:hypothetical protein
MAATIPESLALAPLETLIRLFIAQHSHQKKPIKYLLHPIASLFPYLVSVISSIIFKVNKLSINPTPAIITAYGKIKLRFPD